MKNTQQLKILRTWIKIYANSFVKTLVNIMKWINEGALKIITRKKLQLRTTKNIAPK